MRITSTRANPKGMARVFEWRGSDFCYFACGLKLHGQKQDPETKCVLTKRTILRVLKHGVKTRICTPPTRFASDDVHGLHPLPAYNSDPPAYIYIYI